MASRHVRTSALQATASPAPVDPFSTHTTRRGVPEDPALAALLWWVNIDVYARK